jgi:hypothetical protein
VIQHSFPIQNPSTAVCKLFLEHGYNNDILGIVAALAQLEKKWQKNKTITILPQKSINPALQQ